MKIKRIITRLTAGSVTVLFLVTNHFLPPAFASVAGSREQVCLFPAISSLDRITIPQELGRIQELHQGTGKETVILIQDAHSIPDAQRSIQRLIEYFESQYGINRVALEGASSSLDPQIFRSFPDQKILKRVFEEYRDAGELAGGPAAAVFSPHKASYFGIEDWDLYEEGIRLYQEAISKEQELNSLLTSIESNLLNQSKTVFVSLHSPHVVIPASARNRTDPSFGGKAGIQSLDSPVKPGNDTDRQSAVFSSPVRTFQEKKTSFQKNEIDLIEYVKELKELFENTTVARLFNPVQTSPAVIPAKAGIQNSLDSGLRRNDEKGKVSERLRETFDAAQTQMIQAFKERILPKLPRETQIELNQMIQLHNIGHLSQGMLVKRIEDLSREFNFQFKTPQILKQAVHQARTLESIKGTSLFNELESLEARLRETFPQTEAERTLLQEFHHLELLKRLSKLELTRKEWKELKQCGMRNAECGMFVGIQNFRHTNGGSVLWRTKLKTSATKMADPSFGGQNLELRTLLASHFRFYELASQRDAVLFKNLLKFLSRSPRHPTPDTRQPARSALLITGGFHSEGLAAKLKEKNISYLLIAPRMDSVPEETNYRAHMKGEVSWKDYFEIENGRANLYNAFVRAARDRLLSNSKLKTQNSKLLKPWRDQIIRDLADQNRIEDSSRYTRFLDELSSIQNSKSKIQNSLLPRLEQFIEGITRLQTSNQLTEDKILKLLQPAMTADLTYGVLSKDSLPASALGLEPVVSQVGSKKLEVQEHSAGARRPAGEKKRFEIRNLKTAREAPLVNSDSLGVLVPPAVPSIGELGHKKQRKDSYRGSDQRDFKIGHQFVSPSSAAGSSQYPIKPIANPKTMPSTMLRNWIRSLTRPPITTMVKIYFVISSAISPSLVRLRSFIDAIVTHLLPVHKPPLMTGPFAAVFSALRSEIREENKPALTRRGFFKGLAGVFGSALLAGPVQASEASVSALKRLKENQEKHGRKTGFALKFELTAGQRRVVEEEVALLADRYAPELSAEDRQLIINSIGAPRYKPMTWSARVGMKKLYMVTGFASLAAFAMSARLMLKARKKLPNRAVSRRKFLFLSGFWAFAGLFGIYATYDAYEFSQAAIPLRRLELPDEARAGHTPWGIMWSEKDVQERGSGLGFRGIVHHELIHFFGDATPDFIGLGKIARDAVFAEAYTAIRMLEIGGLKAFHSFVEEVNGSKTAEITDQRPLLGALFYEKLKSPIERDKKARVFVHKWIGPLDLNAESDDPIYYISQYEYSYLTAGIAWMTAKGNAEAARRYLDVMSRTLDPVSAERAAAELVKSEPLSESARELLNAAHQVFSDEDLNRIFEQIEPSRSEVRERGDHHLVYSNLDSYYRILRRFSTGSWDHADVPFLESTDWGLSRLFPAIENAGEVMFGIGFQQNFSLAIHGRPSLYVILDINPVVTEVMIPLFGHLMEMAPTRRDFLALLSGLDLTEEDVRELLETPNIEGEQLRIDHVQKTLDRLVPKTPFDKRNDKHRQLLRIADKKILSQLQLRSPHRKLVFDVLNEFFGAVDDRYGYFTRFINEHAEAAWIARNDQERKQWGTWLSSEENYERARSYWIQGRFIGVTGDVMGQSISKVGEWLKEERNEKVSVLYPGNVDQWVFDPGRGGTQTVNVMYDRFGDLPLKDDTKVIISKGHPIDYQRVGIRSFERMRWLYRYLSTDDYYVWNYFMERAFLSNEPPFERLKHTVRNFFQERGLMLSQEEGSEKQYRIYMRLIEKIESQKDQVNNLTPSEFSVWVSNQMPELDTSTAYFRGVVIILVDSGLIRPSLEESGYKPELRSRSEARMADKHSKHLNRRQFFIYGGVAAAGAAGLAIFRQRFIRFLFERKTESTRMAWQPLWKRKKTSESYLDSYYQTLRELSTGSWHDIRRPYFVPSDLALGTVHPRLKRRGGAMLGVGFQQNFSFAFHGEPSKYIFLDINPAVTEVFVPFFGRLFELAETRREFLSALTGIELTEEDVSHLLEPNVPLEVTLSKHLQSVISEIVNRVPLKERRRRHEINKRYFESEILSRLSLSPIHKELLLTWFDDFLKPYPLEKTKDKDPRSSFVEFLKYNSEVSRLWQTPQEKQDHGTWLSSEANYRRIRFYWLEKRFVGVTADIKGPSIPILAEWLRRHGEQISTLYVSNVHHWIGPKSSRVMYQVLSKLPLTQDALVLMSQGVAVLTPVVRAYQRMRWLYEFVSTEDEDERVFPTFIERPLSGKSNAPLPEFLEYFSLGLEEFFSLGRFEKNKEAGTSEHAAYRKAFETLNKSPQAIETLGPEQFTEWVRQNVPELKTDTDYFRAFVFALVDRKFLKPSPDEAKFTPRSEVRTTPHVETGIRRRISKTLIPRFEEKERLVKEIKELGGGEPRIVTGWKLASVEYLESVLQMLKDLPPDRLLALKKIRFVPWWRSIGFFVGIGGYVLEGSEGPRQLNVVLAPHHAVFQWNFGHELMHVAAPRNSELVNNLAQESWKSIAPRKPASPLAMILIIETAASLFLSASMFFQPIAQAFTGTPLTYLFALSALTALGIGFSVLTGGLFRRSLALLFGSEPVYVFDPAKPWTIITPYSLVSPAEEAADLGAAYMLFPKQFKEKENLSGKYRILYQFFGRKDFAGLPPHERIQPNPRPFSIRTWFIFSLTVHVWLLALLLPGIAGEWPWRVFRFAEWAAVVTTFFLVFMRPILSLRINLSFAKKWPERMKQVIRQTVSSVFSVVQETSRLGLVAVLAMFLMHPTPIERSLRTRMETKHETVKKEPVTIVKLIELTEPIESGMGMKKVTPAPKTIDFASSDAIYVDLEQTSTLQVFNAFSLTPEKLRGYFYGDLKVLLQTKDSEPENFSFGGMYQRKKRGESSKKLVPLTKIDISLFKEFVIDINSDPGLVEIEIVALPLRGSGWHNVSLEHLRVQQGRHSLHISVEKIRNTLQELEYFITPGYIYGFEFNFGKRESNPQPLRFFVEEVRAIPAGSGKESSQGKTGGISQNVDRLNQLVHDAFHEAEKKTGVPYISDLDFNFGSQLWQRLYAGENLTHEMLVHEWMKWLQSEKRKALAEKQAGRSEVREKDKEALPSPHSAGKGREINGRDGVRGVVSADLKKSALQQRPTAAQTPHIQAKSPFLSSPSGFQPPNDDESSQIERRANKKDFEAERSASYKRSNDQSPKDNGSGIADQTGQIFPPEALLTVSLSGGWIAIWMREKEETAVDSPQSAEGEKGRRRKAEGGGKERVEVPSIPQSKISATMLGGSATSFGGRTPQSKRSEVRSGKGKKTKGEALELFSKPALKTLRGLFKTPLLRGHTSSYADTVFEEIVELMKSGLDRELIYPEILKLSGLKPPHPLASGMLSTFTWLYEIEIDPVKKNAMEAKRRKWRDGAVHFLKQERDPRQSSSYMNAFNVLIALKIDDLEATEVVLDAIERELTEVRKMDPFSDANTTLLLKGAELLGFMGKKHPAAREKLFYLLENVEADLDSSSLRERTIKSISGIYETSDDLAKRIAPYAADEADFVASEAAKILVSTVLRKLETQKNILRPASLEMPPLAADTEIQQVSIPQRGRSLAVSDLKRSKLSELIERERTKKRLKELTEAFEAEGNDFTKDLYLSLPMHLYGLNINKSAEGNSLAKLDGLIEGLWTGVVHDDEKFTASQIPSMFGISEGAARFILRKVAEDKQNVEVVNLPLNDFMVRRKASSPYRSSAILKSPSPDWTEIPDYLIEGSLELINRTEENNFAQMSEDEWLVEIGFRRTGENKYVSSDGYLTVQTDQEKGVLSISGDDYPAPIYFGGDTTLLHYNPESGTALLMTEGRMVQYYGKEASKPGTLWDESAGKPTSEKPHIRVLNDEDLSRLIRERLTTARELIDKVNSGYLLNEIFVIDISSLTESELEELIDAPLEKGFHGIYFAGKDYLFVTLGDREKTTIFKSDRVFFQAHDHPEGIFPSVQDVVSTTKAFPNIPTYIIDRSNRRLARFSTRKPIPFNGMVIITEDEEGKARYFVNPNPGYPKYILRFPTAIPFIEETKLGFALDAVKQFSQLDLFGQKRFQILFPAGIVLEYEKDKTLKSVFLEAADLMNQSQSGTSRAAARRAQSPEARKAARKVVRVFVGSEKEEGANLKTVAKEVAGTLKVKVVSAQEFGEMLRSEARLLLDQVEREQINSTAPKVDKELAQAAIHWLTEVLKNNVRGDLAVAFNVAVDAAFLDALKEMKSRIGLAFFQKEMIREIDPKALEGLRFQVLKNLARYRPVQGLAFQNSNALPVVSGEETADLSANAALFEVGVMNPDKIVNEPYLEGVEKILQIVSGLLTADMIQNTSVLKNSVEAENIKAELLKKLFKEEALPDLILFQNGNLLVNRSSLLKFVTEHLAQKAAEIAA